MMDLRFYLLITLAVSCHGLPKTAEDAVVPERQTMLPQHAAAFTKMSPTAFISAMTSAGGSEADCRTFADETIKVIKNTVTSTQGEVDAIATGSGCAAMGQAGVTAATTVVTAAKTELETAKTDAATKQTAEEAACSATFQVAPLSLTVFKSGVLNKACLDISNMASYTTADAACTSATAISVTADQAVATVTTKITDAEAALAAAVKEAAKLKTACFCRVRKQQKAAWAAASTATASHAADWKQAHELICALDQATTCNVQTCPAVTQPTLDAGVAGAVCFEAITFTTCCTTTTCKNDRVKHKVGAGLTIGPTQAQCDAVSSPISGLTVNQGYQKYRVQHAGTYKITANGAKGGNHGGGLGGYGAQVTGTATLAVGDTLVVVVGQEGGSNPANTDWGGGGGGGTFVAKMTPGSGLQCTACGGLVEILMVAGGGAGVADSVNSGQADGGQATTGDPNSGSVGGQSGGGAGLKVDGSGGGTTAKSFLNGAVGGGHGSYNGGFGGAGGPYNGAGGGGGYSGGYCTIGGTDNGCYGGTSYGGTMTANANNGDGNVVLSMME